MSKCNKPKLTMGERFKDARTVHNQHGKELTGTVQAATGISKSTISEIENDKRDPGAKIISTLARHYGVSSDYLLGLSDVVTPNTAVQAVIAYTGLSEDNVVTLHAAKNQADSIGSFSYGVTRQADGHIPFLDCANDLLHAMYADQEIISEYFLLRAQILSALDYDPNFFVEELEKALYAHGQTTMPVKRAATYSCAELSKRIEWYLRNKYINGITSTGADPSTEG